jgi:hypothetical protein
LDSHLKYFTNITQHYLYTSKQSPSSADVAPSLGMREEKKEKGGFPKIAESRS